MMDHVGRFMVYVVLYPCGTDILTTFQHRTLRKICTFLEAQYHGNKLKRLFHSSETNNMLKECRAGLQYAREVFKVCHFFPSSQQLLNTEWIDEYQCHDVQ
jgi:hypothetical protein